MDLKTLPEEIKDWIASENITYLISDLNNRLNIHGQNRSAIALLIFNLIVKELEPNNFFAALAEEWPDRKPEEISVVIKEIKEKILKPIEMPLRLRLGIDIRAVPETLSKTDTI